MPRSIFIYTGNSVSLDKRQMLNNEWSESDSSTAFAAPSSLSILQRYQLLTPALIMGLIVVLFLLLPLMLVAINALGSIQTPTRMQSSPGLSRDKKNQ